MDQSRTRPSRMALNLLIDTTIFIAFLVAMAPRFSGIAIHEWLSIAFGAAIITHLLLHWQWLVGVTKRFFGKTPWLARANYVLNTLLFVSMTVIIVSGLLISEEALPLLGIPTAHGGVWRRLHTLSADVTVLLIGLHLAMHWSWMVRAVRRYVVAPLRGQRQAGRPQVAAGSAGREV